MNVFITVSKILAFAVHGEKRMDRSVVFDNLGLRLGLNKFWNIINNLQNEIVSKKKTEKFSKAQNS